MTTTGHGMLQAIDLLLQEAIVIGLHLLAENPRAIEELMGRTDSLRHNTTDQWRRELREALIAMLDPRNTEYVAVMIGYPPPHGQAHLPCVTIVLADAADAEGTIGDDLRVAPTPDQRTLVGPAQELYETEERGTLKTSTVEIGSWTIQPELTALLHAAVAWALQQMDGHLVDNGIHGLSDREGGFAPSDDLEPRVGYVPLHRVTAEWTQRQSSRRKVPNRIRFLAPTFST